MAADVGQMAPDFKLKTHKMEEVTLSAQRGKSVLLLFFPLAFTGTWTKEMGLVEARKQEIYGANGVVYGISVDSPFSQAKWAEQEGYNFPLLSDLGKDVSRAYGSIYEDLNGMKGVSKRSAFLIDKTGKIVKKEVLEAAKDLPDLDGFIAELKKLK